MYSDKFGMFFGRLNENGDVVVLHENGEIATRIDANVYPIDSETSAKYDHPAGIILARSDADKLGLEIE